MKSIDLHTHSNCSDGSLSPTELLYLGVRQGLAAIALTDHDTVKGLPEAKKASENLDIEFVPGVELSCYYGGREIHIVGLDIDMDNPALSNKLIEIQRKRIERNKKMVDKMREDGIDITYDYFINLYGEDAILTRAHFGKMLVDKGIAKDINEAFKKYIGDGCKYYVEKEHILPKEAIDMILNNGGIPILAHPLRYNFDSYKLDKCVSELKEYGLQGIEVFYSANLPGEENIVKDLAKKYGLKQSGGSDFHGDKKPDIALGTGRNNNLFIPYDKLIELRA